MSETTETQTNETTGTETVAGEQLVLVKVLGGKTKDGKRVKCVVNGYVCRPGLYRHVPKEAALKLENMDFVQIEGA